MNVRWSGPSSKAAAELSKVTLGATLLTLTSCDASALTPASSSVACTVTSAARGPSGKSQRKLPPVFVCASDPATFVPGPHEVTTDVIVSAPGSVIA